MVVNLKVRVPFYNPDIARWLIQDQDPLAEKYYGVSLYACCLNNPVKQVGSDGGGGYLVPGAS